MAIGFQWVSDKFRRMNKMAKKKVKLTERDFDLIALALDVLSSDYDPAGPSGPEPYRVKMQNKINKLENKLLNLRINKDKIKNY